LVWHCRWLSAVAATLRRRAWPALAQILSWSRRQITLQIVTLTMDVLPLIWRWAAQFNTYCIALAIATGGIEYRCGALL
jgi:hypothetical protein